MMYKWVNNSISKVPQDDLNRRASKYGDGFFETILANEHTIQHYDFHYDRIVKSFGYLYFDKTTLPHKDELQAWLLSFLPQNNAKKNKISLHFQRDAVGQYSPSSNEVIFSAEVTDYQVISSLDAPNYRIGIYTETRKFPNPIASIKSSNALIYVLAAAWKDMAGIEDAIILNNDNHICEATASNIFMVKDRKIITPPLRDAPVDGIMRRFIIETLASKNVSVIEKSVTDKDVFEADEIFLTNTLKGIQSVTGFGDVIQYKNEYTQEIRLLLEMV